LTSDRGRDGGLICWVDAKSFRDTVDSDIYAVLVVGLEGAVGEGGVEEVADSERQALLRCGCLSSLLVFVAQPQRTKYLTISSSHLI
jgi:hypothetical protein